MKIYYNGYIQTMEDQKYATYVVTNSNKIIEIGYSVPNFSLFTNAEKVDLKGKAMYPAFIDSHSHFSAFGNILGIVSLQSAKNFSDIKKLIKSYMKKNKTSKEEWIIGFGYDHNNMKEKSHPTIALLDEISKTNPLMITHSSGHMGVCNSLALQKLNITEDMEIQGGVIGKDENGLTGYLEEKAFTDCKKLIPKITDEKMLAYLEDAEKIYLQNGISTVQEGLMGKAEFDILKKFTLSQKNSVDIIGYLDKDEQNDIILSNNNYTNYINHFKIGGLKIFLDGSPQAKTAWLSESYENDENYLGYPILTKAEIVEYIKIALEKHMQILAHCNGDRACGEFISALEEFDVNEIRKIRPVMIHAQLCGKAELEKMAKMNVIPSFFVSHAYYYGDIHLKNLGKRAEKISPTKTALKLSIPFTIHNDSPVLSPNLLDSVQIATLRTTSSGVVLGEGERVSVYEAMKAITINGAYQYFEEDIKGSIKVNKYADFVILDRDPLTTDLNEIKNIKVLQTIIRDEIKYKQN